MFNLLKFVFSPRAMCELFTFYGGDKGGGDAPDFTAVAAAADKAAVLGKELGDAQLAENTRQYDQNMAVTTPVVNAQLGLMNMTKEQGDDYFNYMKDYSRPVEKQLYYEAMGFTPQEIAQIEDSRTSETAAARATYQAEQSKIPKVMQQSVDIPTFTKQMDVDGVVKGSDLKEGIRLTKSSANADARLVNYGTSAIGGVAGTNGQVDAMGRTIADPNLYYRKDKLGTYSIVEPQYSLVEGKQTIKFDVPTGAGTEEKTVFETPETEKLISQLSTTAKARLDAMDKTERDAILAKNGDLEGRIGETDTQVYNRYADDIEAEAGQAVADSRAGFTNAVNVAARQGLRYGFSPAKLASMASTQSVQQAGTQAGAANQTRKAATNTMYSRGVGAAQQGLTGLNNNRNLRIQDAAIATAKKQDVAGLYRNLPSASQGSYGLAINAGSSAVQNQNTTSSQYMQGIAQGTGTIMQGQQAKISGLSSAANGQASYAGSQGDNGATMGALGTVAGAAITVF